MSDMFKIHAANLHLFEGGAAGAAGAGGEGAAAGADQAGSQAQAANSQAAPGGDPSADAGQSTTKTPEQLQNEFRELIRGEYKDAYTKEFQKQFNSRHREVKETQERLESYQPIIDTLSSRYGITDGDMSKLSKAIDADEALWAEAADEAGMTVEQYRHVQRIEAENARFKAAREQSLRQQMAQRQFEVWHSQIEGLQKEYPDFDMASELNNPAFAAMLRSGATLKNAYEAAHLDEVKARLVQNTRQDTTKQVTDDIRANGMRPSEVGGSQGAVELTFDLKNSTPKQREAWARRAERGETIRF